MNADDARLYYLAAQRNPFVASWISILDRYQMPCHAEIAPHDWEEAFEQLYLHGLIDNSDFARTNFKREFHRRFPKPKDVADAMGELSSLRQAQESEEVSMPEKFEVLEKSTALAPRNGHDRELARPSEAGGFRTLAPRPSANNVLERAEKNGGGLAAFRPLQPRGTLQPMQPTRHAGLDCQHPEDRNMPDPRPFIEDFSVKILCCGRELELIYDDGRPVSGQDGDEIENMAELIFHTVCGTCNAEGHHSFIRPIDPGAFPVR